MSYLILSVNNTTMDALLGFTFTALLFLICFFLVVGIKICILFSMRKNPFYREETVEVKPQRKKRAKIRTLYINPDEVDRILVKKD